MPQPWKELQRSTALPALAACTYTCWVLGWKCSNCENTAMQCSTPMDCIPQMTNLTGCFPMALVQCPGCCQQHPYTGICRNCPTRPFSSHPSAAAWKWVQRDPQLSSHCSPGLGCSSISLPGAALSLSTSTPPQQLCFSTPPAISFRLSLPPSITVQKNPIQSFSSEKGS